MHIGEIVYEAAMHAAPRALHLLAPFNEKLRRGLGGRRDSLDSLRTWAAARPPDAPLVWLHAPSVGEALMAQAILASLKADRPTLRSLFTFFSPSAERMAARVGADWAGYLPWDRRATMRALLAELRPDALAFVRTEIWPVLGREAQQRGTRVVLVNAVLAEHSSRSGRAARMLLGPGYRRLDAVGAVTAEDIPRFVKLGVPRHRIVVTGDARFDQVWNRVRSLDPNSPLLQSLRAWPGPRLVAGSTWPADEDVLIPALVQARDAGAPWRVVIAPHEPAPRYIEPLERRLTAHRFSHARLPADGAALPDVDVLVVDRVGVLADLYAAASAAYVGGGFGSAGLHSVVEPAALGVPVVFGPHHGHAREAGSLAAAGGGFIVDDVAGLAGVLLKLYSDGSHRERSGSAARAFVATHAGGAERNARLVMPD